MDFQAINEMSSPDGEKKKAKDRIFGAALELFCRKGYHATSVREIVEAARVTKPVLYYYFKSKEELFHAILEETFEVFQRELRELCERKDLEFRAILTEYARLYFQAAREAPEVVRFVNSIAFSGMYDSLYDFRSRALKAQMALVEVFQRAQEEKKVRRDVSPETLAINFMGLCVSAMRRSAYGMKLDKVSDSESELVEVFLHGATKQGA